MEEATVKDTAELVKSEQKPAVDNRLDPALLMERANAEENGQLIQMSPVNNNKSSPARTPVLHPGMDGNAVLHNNVITARDDGSTSITSPVAPTDAMRLQEIFYLKLFSIIATLLFLPIGIITIVLAWRTERELQQALLTNDFSIAKKFAKLCGRLIIASIFLGLVTGCILLLIFERHSYTNFHHAYFAHKLPV